MTTNPPPNLPGVGGLYPGFPYPLNPLPTQDRAETEEEIILRRQEEQLSRMDVVDVLTREHRAIDELLGRLTAVDATPEHRREVTEVTIAELSRHAAVEQRHVCPTVHDVMPQGERRVAEQLQGHATIIELLRRLGALEPTEPSFDDVCRELAGEMHRHIRVQEEELFPRLREACDREHLLELARRVRAARELAPTRPHPRAPEKPPWRAATDPLIGAIDKIRDEVSGRPTEPRDLGSGPG